MPDFEIKGIAAAIRSERELVEAVKSRADVIFILKSDIMSLGRQIEMVHRAGKRAFIHLDFTDGVAKDRAGLAYIKLQGADGIITTKTGMVRPAKEEGLITVQRFFIVDSHSVDTAVDTIKNIHPDVVEIMPGVITKKIYEFVRRVDMPVLTGGLIETPEEAEAALKAGATAVSTANQALWNYK